MKEWRIIEYSEMSGRRNMEMDEEIFNECESGRGTPTLRFYGWSPWCVSIGRNQDYSVVNLEECKKAGVDVVKRITGGGALLHANEIAYSIISPSDQRLFKGSVEDSYRLTHGWLIIALRKLGIFAEIGEKNSNRVDVCFYSVSSYEIHVNGRKLVGSAQRRGKRAVLQHGSILLKSTSRLTARLLFPPEGIPRNKFRTALQRRSVGIYELIKDEIDKSKLVEILKETFIELFCSVI